MKTILVKSNIEPTCPRLHVRNVIREDGTLIYLDEEVEMDDGPTNVVSVHDCYQFNAEMAQIINCLLDQALAKTEMAIKLAAANLEPLAPPLTEEEVKSMAYDHLMLTEPTIRC
jgi:hypothetical protein